MFLYIFQDEELRYGPFSDGEAETLRRNCHKSYRRSAGGAMVGGSGPHQPPHYVTMTRAQGRMAAAANAGRGRYTSQPQLTGCDYRDNSNSNGRRNFGDMGGRCGSPDTLSLTPLSVRTSVTFPRRSVHEFTTPLLNGSSQRQQQQQQQPDEGVGYPDLARHPLSYTTAPPPQYLAKPAPQERSLYRALGDSA